MKELNKVEQKVSLVGVSGPFSMVFGFAWKIFYKVGCDNKKKL